MRLPETDHALEFAGLVDEDGRPDRPFPVGRLELFYPVKVLGDRDCLVWDHVAPPGPAVAVVPDDLLTRFLRLGLDVKGSKIIPSPESVLAFAEQFGPLRARREMTPAHRAFLRSLPGSWEDAEPLAAWRYYVGAMYSVLEIAAAFRNGTPPRAEDWAAITPHGGWLNTAFLSHVLNGWLALGQPVPAFWWDAPSGEPRFFVESTSLFGVLALKLVQAVAAIEGWALCQGCGTPFAVHMSGPGRRTRYCPACGPQARARRASKRYYDRKKAQHDKAPRAR